MLNDNDNIIDNAHIYKTIKFVNITTINNIDNYYY